MHDPNAESLQLQDRMHTSESDSNQTYCFCPSQKMQINGWLQFESIAVIQSQV